MKGQFSVHITNRAHKKVQDEENVKSCISCILLCIIYNTLYDFMESILRALGRGHHAQHE